MYCTKTFMVSTKVGMMRLLFRYTAYACQIAASTSRMNPLRT
jgi:hypothetical protein